MLWASIDITWRPGSIQTSIRKIPPGCKKEVPSARHFTLPRQILTWRASTAIGACSVPLGTSDQRPCWRKLLHLRRYWRDRPWPYNRRRPQSGAELVSQNERNRWCFPNQSSSWYNDDWKGPSWSHGWRNTGASWIDPTTNQGCCAKTKLC